MYNVLKYINDNTLLVEEDNAVFIAKVIAIDDIDIYKTLFTINNPNIVKFIGTATIDNQLCVIEEYIKGVTLERYIENNSLSDDNIVNIVLQVCNGLEQIHNNGIVHRDINPSNIMITPDNRAVIIDFGISRVEKKGKSADTQILGTQGYAAPEQYGFSQTSAKADIYSIGVLINYMKTGALPNATLCDGWLGDVVTKCIQIDEARRYSSISDLTKAISNRGHMFSFFNTIPGFRQRKWWHILIASIYYFAFVFLLYIAIDMAESTQIAFYYSMVILFMLGVPVPILTNFLDWTNRVNGVKNNSRSTKIVTQVLLAILSCIIATVFIILSPVQ